MSQALDHVPWPQELAQRYRDLGLWRGETLGQVFLGWAERFAERTALIEGGRELTYSDLAQEVERYSQGLMARGLVSGDYLVLHLPNESPIIAVLLACFHRGVVPVLALPGHRQRELSAFIGQTGARALVTHLPRQDGPKWLQTIARIEQAHPSLEQVFVWSGVSSSEVTPHAWLPNLRQHSGMRAGPPFSNAAAVALLQLSGGSTGIPKLIPRTHDDYLCSVRLSAQVCKLSHETRYLAALPITHNFPLSSPGVLGVLASGGAVHGLDEPTPSRTFAALASSCINMTAAVPSLAQAWLEVVRRRGGPSPLAGVRLQVGGAKLDPIVARALGCEAGCLLQQVFGMAEGLVNYTRFDDPPELIETTQGRPMSDHDEVRIVDPLRPSGPVVAPGDVGELQTRGPYTIRGYFKGIESDPQRFTADGFYRTGDLVRQLPSGHLVVEGRLGHHILRNGEKVAPEEVEGALRAHPSVADVALIGVHDPTVGERAVAVVQPEPGAVQLGLREVRAFLRAAGFAEFKLPDRLHIVSSLPRTAVGKLDRIAVKHCLSQPLLSPPEV